MSGTSRLPDAAARRKAVVIAGHTGDLATARGALVDPDPGVRGAAVGALVRLGAASTDDLRAALADLDPAVRRRAAEEAARAGATELGRELAILLTDDIPLVAESAAAALGELGVGVDALIGAARHDDVLVREAAVAALGAVGDTAGLDAVLRACDDVATVRRRAVLALAAFDGPDVEAALHRLASDRDRQIRQAAEDLLHGWGTS